MGKEPTVKKERATADGVSGIGAHRYGLYRAAWDRVQESAEAGYFLEAITLIESLLSDRMESRASYLTGRNEGFSTLGALVKLFRKHEQVPEFRTLIDQIDGWRIKRNRALHEMVKFVKGEFPTWEQQAAGLNAVVREGQLCLCEFAAIDACERERNGARPPATWPHAFDEDVLHR
jgi:hypothetical protein